MMPTFRLNEFLPALLDYVGAHPLLWSAFVLLACAVVIRLVLASGLSVTTRHRRYELAMQRVRLDAVARMHDKKGQR